MGDLPQKTEGRKTRRGAKFNRLSLPVAVISATIVLLVGISIGVAVYFFNKYEDTKAVVYKTTIAEETKNTVVQDVAKIYAVPQEDPTLARVNDPVQLRKDQEFFTKAEQGDYVLVYPKAQLAILYRESSDKIINVGPVSLAPNATTPQGTTEDSAAETEQ